MRMLVETKDCGFRSVEIDGLYPIGTPLPSCPGGFVYYGKVVGYGQTFEDGLPTQHYILHLDEDYRLDTGKIAISRIVVHPGNIHGSVQCDPDAGGCGCEFRMSDSVLHRWLDGELSWMCKECAG